jgi:hypothetical protein
MQVDRSKPGPALIEMEPHDYKVTDEAGEAVKRPNEPFFGDGLWPTVASVVSFSVFFVLFYYFVRG